MSKPAQAASKFKKYTAQPTGVWRLINRFLAIDPNRSTGVPLNSQFRNPPPGANDPNAYDDPVTIPAGDIAENPYWKRDLRRRYPRLSAVRQADVVGLLAVGSKQQGKVELIGEAGKNKLVAVKDEGEKGGLAVYLEKEKSAAASVLGPNGLPPLPSGLHRTGTFGEKKYDLSKEQSYEGKYSCRTFA
ncbi:NADH-ubiquinone oxidoreductase 21.3 kDa subunit [Phyllosticta citriasiana]|uniref:NADH-ubiquinone oxidoreductase 21.3 kDa subunit n=1 Tax=Phyllosticta citriasiana TaxID=595635 RepID=A0ABR1L016_9PEZI